jgi:hypothetical protein
MLRFCARLVIKSWQQYARKTGSVKTLLPLSENVKETTMECSFRRPRDKNNVSEIVTLRPWF